jgi:hypothetical protein
LTPPLKDGYGYLTDRTTIDKAHQYRLDVDAQQRIEASVVAGMFVQQSLIHHDGRLRENMISISLLPTSE